MTRKRRILIAALAVVGILLFYAARRPEEKFGTAFAWAIDHSIIVCDPAYGCARVVGEEREFGAWHIDMQLRAVANEVEALSKQSLHGMAHDRRDDR